MGTTNELALRRLLLAASPRPWRAETVGWDGSIRILDANGYAIATMTGDNAALVLSFANNLGPLLEEFAALKAGQ